MAKEKSHGEHLAEEIKKAISKAKRESADVESPESLLAVEGEIRQSLLDIQKDALQKLKAGDERHDQIEKLLASENERLVTLSSDFKKNEDFEKRIRTNIAASRAASSRAAAETDDFSQKTATLSAKDLQVKGDSGLTRLIQNYAEEMASSITQMRALGLPAKKFTKNTLEILASIKKSIDVDPALNGETVSDAAKEAKKQILAVLDEHEKNVTEAGTLSPLALLGKNLAGGLKEKAASVIKAIPGMGAMDAMAGLMGLRTISERIDETITGKSDITREGDAGVADIKSDVAEGAERRLEEYSWSGLNTDTVARSQAAGEAARVAAEVIAENIREEFNRIRNEEAGAGSPRRVRDRPDRGVRMERAEGDNRSFGALDALDFAPAPVGDSTGYSTGYSTGVSGGGDVVPILTRIVDTLVETKEQDKEIHESEKAERLEDRHRAAERRAAAEGTTPIPALDELSNSPIPASAGAGGGGGKGGGKGGGIGGIIGNFIGGVGGGVIAGFMKTVGSVSPAIAGKFIIAIAALGVGLGAFFVALAGAAKIIQIFGGGEAVQSLLTNAAAGLTAFNTIDGVNLLAVGAGMVALGAGLIAITGGSILSGLYGLLTIGDPLGDTARSLQSYNDIDGDNLLAVGKGMTALSRGIKSLTNDGMITGFKNFMSSAAGAIAGAFGWLFGADEETEAEKKLGILGFVKQFEDIDADKLNESSAAIMKLAAALTALSDARRRENLGPGATSPTPTPTPTPEPAEGSDASAPPEFDAAPFAAGPLPTPGSDAYASLRIKGSSGRTQMGGSGQATGGGPSHKGVTDFAAMIQENVGGFQRFTAFNDNHHQSSKTSKHAQGLAMDFTVAGGDVAGARAASTVRRLADEVGMPRNDMLVLDEYNYPSKGSTGDHVHVGFNTEAAAMKMVELDTSPTGVPPATASVFLAGATPSLDAGGTGSPRMAAQSQGAPGASRNGANLAAASARQASLGAAAPVIVASLGPSPPAAAAAVPTVYPVVIPTNPHNPDQVLRGIVSVGGGGYNA